ncbi:MAG: hypothetical protein U1G07_13665 [Verrucomicrobiota bacterium]
MTLVGANCAIAADAHLFPNVVLYPRTQLGLRVRIHAGTVIALDGFPATFSIKRVHRSASDRSR